MAVKILPDVCLLRQIFDYNSQTGEILHKPRPRSMFKSDKAFKMWHTRYAGRPAAQPHKGYLCVCVYGTKYFAHRIAYKIYYGAEPPELLDHANKSTLDNRIANLRPATKSQNVMNTARRNDNTSGYKGVHFKKQIGKYIASITVNGKQSHLGVFDTAESARAAYANAARLMHGEFASAS